MEEVTYRNSKLQVKTIPKGTLLFRLTKNVRNDLRGVELDDGTRCVTPNFNVFFYPDPFTAGLSFTKLTKETDMMAVFILKKDVKVLWLLNPSKYTRNTKNTRRRFVTRCNRVKQGCMPRPLKGYDPCLSKTMIEKYPDIVGMVAVAYTDSERLKENLRDNPNKTRKIRKYLHFAEDSRKADGVPEIVLHPFVKRPSKDVIVHKGDELEINYKLLTILKLNDYPRLIKFMDQHAVYDPDTFYYTYKS